MTSGRNFRLTISVVFELESNLQTMLNSIEEMKVFPFINIIKIRCQEYVVSSGPQPSNPQSFVGCDREKLKKCLSRLNVNV